ncbi:hypothetical protein ACFL0M_09260 [Thermodesulfobacteriota bacterium]
MKIKLVFIFSWAIAIAVLFVLIQAAVIGDNRIILTNFQNPLIRYSLPLFGVNICIVLFLVPIFMHRGIITSDFYNADKYTKAKSEFIILSISAPGLILLSLAVYHLASNSKLLYILVGLLFFMYISSILTLLKHNKD